MKKYLFSLTAVVLAVAWVSFTTHLFKREPFAYFTYLPNDGVSESRYESTSPVCWSYSSIRPISCPGNTITCVVEVDLNLEPGLVLTPFNEAVDFANFLASQTMPNTWTGATSYVSTHVIDKKFLSQN